MCNQSKSLYLDKGKSCVLVREHFFRRGCGEGIEPRLVYDLPDPWRHLLVLVGADHSDLVTPPGQLLPNLHHADLDTPEDKM